MAGSRLEGKVAIITGGASGIGEATVELFAEEGALVVIADVNDMAGEELANKLGKTVAYKRTDVSNGDDVQAVVDFAVEQFGGLDVMFNNAGISSAHGGVLDIDFTAEFQRIMGVNLYGVIIGCQCAGRYMASHGGGSIINTSSIAGISGGGPTTYAATKAAVIHMSKAIAVNLAPYEIRVNCIAPGHILTPITSYDMDLVIRTTQPLQRHGSARDVAETVLFYASDQSAQITGTLLPVDGGTVAGLPPNVMQQLLSSKP